MPIQTIYAALNGMEIRRIVKERLIKAIDELPLLKVGNTFHRAEVQFGFTMTAYPSDVPVPEKELEFHIIDETLLPDWNAHILKLTELDEVHKRLVKKQGELNQVIQVIESAKQNLIVQEDVFQELKDSGIPDQVRADNNLDIPTENRSGGKIVESSIPASSLFKKEASI